MLLAVVTGVTQPRHAPLERALRSSMSTCVDALDALVARLPEPERVLPGVLAVAAAVPIALLAGAPAGAIGLGAVLGLIAGGSLAWYAHARAAARAAALERSLAEAGADADGRVEVVKREHEWAVREVARLRDELRLARAERPGDAAWHRVEPEASAPEPELEHETTAERQEPADPIVAPVAPGRAVVDKRGRIWRSEPDAGAAAD